MALPFHRAAHVWTDDWAWTVAWWLEAASSTPVWRLTLATHPRRRCAPIGRWILERALERASPRTRPEIEAALAWIQRPAGAMA